MTNAFPLSDIASIFGDFAEKSVASLPDLSKSSDFPADLWAEMGKAGLLGLGIAPEYGGAGGGAAEIQEAGRALVSRGHCLGLGLSWLIHAAASRYVLGRLATESQKARFLPLMARGEITASIAMSEPGAGAHPKRLSTRAEAVSGGWEISGQKAFLTNGPVAEIFIVVAITGENNGKKEFSAFIVSRSSPGVATGEAMRLEILRPSPHCGLLLDKARVPADFVLEGAGRALDLIVKPFRTVEDVLLMGPVTGGLEALARGAAAAVKTGADYGEDKAREDFGRFFSMIEALSAIAEKAGRLLDRGGDENALSGLCVAFRAMASEAGGLIDRILAESGAELDENLKVLALDLAASAKIASGVTALKQKKLGGLFLAQS